MSKARTYQTGSRARAPLVDTAYSGDDSDDERHTRPRVRVPLQGRPPLPRLHGDGRRALAALVRAPAGAVGPGPVARRYRACGAHPARDRGRARCGSIAPRGDLPNGEAGGIAEPGSG